MKFILMFMFLLIADFAGASPSCENDLLGENLIHIDLNELQKQETEGLTPGQVTNLNERLLTLYETRPIERAFTGSARGVLSVDAAYAESLMTSVFTNPIINYEGEKSYQQPDLTIGYCFGRALYLHLALLKLGVAPTAIKKAWIVGPRFDDGVMWAFHVATMVAVEGQGWVVIDTTRTRPMPLREWFDSFKGQSEKGDTRLYVSDPMKFSVTAGGYDRLQLGLSLSRKKDWYRGYFTDLMKWFDTKAKSFFTDLHLMMKPELSPTMKIP